MKKERRPWVKLSTLFNFCAVAFILLVVGCCLPPNQDHFRRAIVSICLQNSREIGLSLYKYSVDHGGHYPIGETSTEVFQHLLDEKYVTDPSIFYLKELHIQGKTPPVDNHLKAENVIYDVTCCADSSSPDGLPMVYLTGFKIVYLPGAAAVPLYPPLLPPATKTWFQSQGPSNIFQAVCYKDNSAKAIMADKDGSIPNFIPADFDPKGKTYRQLTP